MNEENIKKYAKLMSELGLTGLEITEGDRKIRLERTAREEVKGPESQGTPLPADEERDETFPAGRGNVFTSPMVGILYLAPAENAAPYVQVGDRVHKGDTLCIIEAMKLMNEVVAERDATVAEICVSNGQVVEFGTELFRFE